MSLATMSRWPKLLVWALMFESALAQSENPDRFFPSTVGNKWKWRSNLTGAIRIDEITRDSADGVGNRYLFFNGDTIPLYKLDTLHQVYFLSKVTDSTGRLIRVDSFLWYKLDAQPGDSFLTLNGSDSIVVSSWGTSMFGVSTTILQFMGYLRYSNRPFAFHSLAKDFGFVHSSTDLGSASSDEDVTGCIIDGVAFGTLASVAQGKPTSLLDFELFQNYPNPFNPSTTISFRTSKRSHVKAEVRDVLGQLVATLEDGYLEPGLHFFFWHPTHVASGTYLCSVQQDGVSKVIKTLLMR